MSGTITTVGEVTDILSGFAFDSKHFNTSQGVPVIRIRDVVRGYSDTKYNGSFSSDFVVSDGDLLIGMDGEFNIAPWSGGDALLNQRVCRISSKNSAILDERYLLHFLPKELKRIEEKTPFVTVKHLSIKTIRAIQIPLPPIQVQRQISDTLDKADALRRKDQELLQKYDELAQCIFYEMFGDPVQNEKGWPLQKLGSIARITSGGTPNRSKPEYYINGNIPWVKTGDLKQRHLSTASEYITQKAVDESSAKIFPSGTVLVALYGATIGACSILTFPAATNQACGAILPSKSLLEEFLYWYFIIIREKLISLGVGGAQPNISGNILKNLNVIVPPKSVQEAFCGQVNNVFKQRESVLNSQLASSMLFNKLLSTYFTAS